MKIVIDIGDNIYTRLFDNGVDDLDDPVDIATVIHDIIDIKTAIRKGTPVPDDAKILTKEAYSDLCMRAAPDFESEEYINERINNYNKMLKSGILDCVIEKSQESVVEE